MTRTKSITLGLAGLTLGLMLPLLMRCTSATPPTPAPATETAKANVPAPTPAMAPASTATPAPAVAAAPPPPPVPFIAPPEAKKQTNPVKATKESLSQGKQMYMQGCYACHGEKGDGRGPNAYALTPLPTSFTDQAAMAKVSDGELFWKITNGNGNGGKGMPAYNNQYSDTDRWNLVNYIRSFKAEKAAATATTGKKPTHKKP
jgi:mono/diheme cytochrome c family protein